MPVGDNDVIRGVLNMTMQSGDVAKNIFTWGVDKVSVGDFSDVAIGAIVADAIELIFAELVGDIGDTTTFDTVDVYKRDGLIWDYIVTAVPSITPTVASGIIPPGAAALMTAYTGLNRVFGRKFIYGFTEDGLSNGHLSVSALAALADAALEYISSYSGGTMGPLDFLDPGVWSTKMSGFVPFGLVAVVKDTVSYQRRRKTNVGV